MKHLRRKSPLSAAQIARPRTILDTFPNPRPNRDYEIKLVFPEFTSICPVTGQPDFATITVTYTPEKKCLEMKSLKLYFFAWRNKGVFFEAAVNTILDDLVSAISPRQMSVLGEFSVRGGMSAVVTAGYHPPVTTRR
jgi:7-cyano-7-deazaguanine reductase